MSRSRKKIAGCKDRNPFMKNVANRKIRRISVEEEIPNGKKYRLYTNPWDICDWAWFLYTESEVRRHCETWETKRYTLFKK